MKITSVLITSLLTLCFTIPSIAVSTELEAQVQNDVMKTTIEQLSVWTEQFLGLPEDEAIILLKQHFGDGVNYSYEQRDIGVFDINLIKVIRVINQFPNSLLELKIHPKTSNIMTASFLFSKYQQTKAATDVKLMPTSLIPYLSDLDGWYQQFIGLSKERAVDILKDYEMKDVKLLKSDPIGKLALYVNYHPRGSLRLFISPDDNKVSELGCHLRVWSTLEYTE